MAEANPGEKVNTRDAKAVKEGGIEMVCLGGFHRIVFGQRGGAITERRRINVIEASAYVPVGLPKWARPMVLEDACVRYKGGFNRAPVVRVLGLPHRTNQDRRNQEDQNQVDDPTRAASQHELKVGRCGAGVTAL
jgi:hypothetical protein